MYFQREQWERRFQLSYNRGCMRTDVLHSLCISAFALSAIYRLHATPGDVALAVTPLLACVPLVLVLTAAWPALYVRHRQPIAAALKVWTAFVASLLPHRHSGILAVAYASNAAEGSPLAMVARAGVGLTAQLVMHALGLQTTGAWLIFSQGFVVAAAMRSTTLCCGSYLADALHQVLSTHGGGWAASLLASTDQSRLCLAYASGMQIGVGYVGVVLVGLLAEWRQRMAFAAKHQLPPPAMIDLFALNGTLLSMLFFVWRVALAEALRLPGSSTCDAAGSVCAARP
ncbi:peptidase S15 [Micractinium conductrix]|uniref:Peptidase S15 n=1 Tax=Micractinium conductrix TaxID=554055 RepID=A0A2P6V2Z6_9CHLO|nr:peptidase S15 [Micractinium conductrix]|eukprot:PSC68463.1 peptidase S15 [Micractinium conductrix]